MGGKNPPPPPDPRPKKGEYLRLTQMESKFLFLCVSKYYEHHAIVEDLVIEESKGDASILLLSKAINSFNDFVSLLNEYRNILEKCSESFLSCSEWNSYLVEQHKEIKELIVISASVVNLINSLGIKQSVIERNFQESLFFDGDNCDIRELNLLISKILNSLLATHDSFVATQNKLISDSDLRYA